MSPFLKHVFLPFLLAFATIWLLPAQCPNLNTNATLVSPDCVNGSTPCDLCPGDQITLTATGTNLPLGGCVDWYYGTTNNFNPYNGQGTLLGCSMIDGPPPPAPCDDCPLTLMLFVDACGQEEDNEWMAIWSGSGFNVDDANLDYDANNNFNPPNDDDVGLGSCGWQEPAAGLIASVQTFCPGATVVGAGPGESVPPGVPVIIYTSSGATFGYNWGSLCPLSPTIYVMQSNCDRLAGAFSNGASIGNRTTIFSLDCGCSDVTTYNCQLLVGGNGAIVIDAGLPFPLYFNAGCGFPNFNFNPPPPPPPPTPDPFTATITQDMCNGGPYWVVGIVDPLGNCPQEFTNYMPFNVICPEPVLQTGETCDGAGLFDLNQLEDPMWPNGTWSGPGVTGNNFDPSGQSGPIELTFTPTANCAVPANTTVTVNPGPTATITPPQDVCEGAMADISINFTGDGPWTFSLQLNGSTVGNFTTSANPFIRTLTFNGPSTVSIINFSDVNDCIGQDADVFVDVIPEVDANISLSGPGTICAGEDTELEIIFNGGLPPFTYVLEVDGIPQAPETTFNNPEFITVSPIDNTVYTLESVSSAGCDGNVSGSASVTVVNPGSGSMTTGSTTICEGQTVTLTFTFTGPTPYVFVYSENGSNEPAITTSNPTYTLTVNPSPGTTIYALESLETNGCDAPAGGSYTVTTSAAPSVNLSGDATICGAGSATLTFNFSTGAGPFTVNYTANGVPQTQFTTTNNPHTIQVNPSITTLYEVTTVSMGACTGSATGSALIEIESPLTATLTGGGQICQGGSGINLTVSFSGSGPYTFVYSANNVNQPAITTTQNPYSLFVNPSVGTFYELVNVSNPDCAGTASGTAQVLVFTPPTAEMLPVTQTFCNQAVTQVEINLTGTGPFTLTYTIDGQSQPPVQTFDDPYFIPVNVTATTVYELTGVQSPGCTGIPLGTATVEVNFAPSYAGVDLSCDLTAGTYVVEFDVVGGEAPYTLVSGSGSFSPTGHFTSNPIPLANNYNIIFHDANDCGDITVSGAPNCNCITEAGTVSLTPVVVCETASAETTFNQDSTLDADDVLKFILHENPAIPLGTIYAWSDTPIFSLPAGVQPGTTLYISAIAGNGLPNGQVDLNDLCLSVSQGTPVEWKPEPTATFGPDVEACVGTVAQVALNLNGFPPFSFVYALDGVPQIPILNYNQTTYNVSFSPTQNTVVTLLSLEDNFCPDGVFTDSALVTALRPPTISNLQTDCDPVAGTYTVEFDLSGEPPFVVSGLTGTLTGTHFVSNPIPIASNFAVNVTDNNNCGPAQQIGGSNCDCATDAGNMGSMALTACETAPITAHHDSTEVLVPGNILRFALHNLPGTTLGTVIQWNTVPVFNFQTGMTLGQTYYISAVAGNPGVGGTINLQDTCTDVAAGTPVSWTAAPTANLTLPNLDICQGENAQLPVSITGSTPMTLVFTYNTVTQPPVVVPSGNSYTLTFTPNQNTTVTISAVSNPGCAVGFPGGTSEVDVDVKPLISNVITTCDLQTGTYVLEFQILGGEPPFTVTGVPGTISGTTFTSNPIHKDSTFTVVLGDQNPCGTDTRAGSANCNCVTNAGAMVTADTLEACIGTALTATHLTANVALDANDTLLYILHTEPGNPFGNILKWSTTPTFDFIVGSMFPERVYFISAIAGDKDAVTNFVLVTDPCLSVPYGTPVVWHGAPTAVLFDNNFDICPGESQPLQLSFTGEKPFFFTYTLNGNTVPGIATQNNFTISTTVLQTSVFILKTVRDNNGCTGTATGMATITVHPTPSIENVKAVCDSTHLNYHVEFDVITADLPSVVIAGSLGGSFNTTTGHFISGPLPATNPYNATVTDMWLCGADSISGVVDCSCKTAAGALPTTPLRLCSGTTATVGAATNPFLEPGDVLIYVLATTPGPPTWTILATNANAPSFGYNASFTPDTTYYILAVAGNNTPQGLDFGDPCLAYSNPTPVSWKPPVTAFLAGNTEICQGDSANLTITLAGGAPYTLSYVINSINPTQIITPNNSYTLTVNPTFSANYSLTSVVGNGCTGAVSGGAAVSVVLPPSLIHLKKTCDFATQTYTVSFDIANGVAPNPAYTVVGVAGSLKDTIFTSAPIPFTQNFDITVSNPTGCDAQISGVSDCFCTSNAGTLDQNMKIACTTDAVIVTHNGDFQLDPEDGLQYILYQNPTLLPAGVLATSNNPQFSFLPGMTPGTTYYVSAVVGDKILATGNVNLQDPCLSISVGAPVQFVEGPTATVVGDTSVCPGGSALVRVNFTGQGPFTFEYGLNGSGQGAIITPQPVYPISLTNILNQQVVNLVSVKNALCPGKISGQAKIEILPGPTGSISGDATVCPGYPATLTLNLSGGGPYNVVLSDGTVLTGVQNGHQLDVSPTQSTTYTITSLTSTTNPCTPSIGGGAKVTVVPLVPTIEVSQINGFNVSCYDAADGWVKTTASGGQQPYSYAWSNGLIGADLTGLSVGSYVITVTDGKGCTGVDSVELKEPPAIGFTVSTVDASCAGQETGRLIVDNISGGNGPFKFTLNNSVSQTTSTFPLVFDDLAPGNYQVDLTDANGCLAGTSAEIESPEELYLDLGDDLQLFLGDSATISPVTNVSAIDSIIWKPTDYLFTPDSLETIVKPLKTTMYELILKDTAGCVVSDQILVSLENRYRVYVPNTIYIGAGTQNEFFTIFGGPELIKINFLRIYDRWGECLYNASDLPPNDIQKGWSGYWRDKDVLPGVYIYVAELLFVDGKTEIFKGDLTVLRK